MVFGRRNKQLFYPVQRFRPTKPGAAVTTGGRTSTILLTKFPSPVRAGSLVVPEKERGSGGGSTNNLPAASGMPGSRLTAHACEGSRGGRRLGGGVQQ